MNWTFIVGMLCGATTIVAIEGVIILFWTFKGIKDGIWDEASENDS